MLSKTERRKRRNRMKRRAGNAIREIGKGVMKALELAAAIVS